MKRKHRKKFRRIIKIVILIFLLYFINNNNIKDKLIVGKNYNNNYSGIGQKEVKDKDGYSTVFVTKNKKEYIEYKQNGSSSWRLKEYWGGTMEENGCGITAMSIILSGYEKNITPEDLRKKYYPVLDYSKLSEELNYFGIENSDFIYASAYFSKNKLIEHLQTDRPILICVSSGKKSNRWTKKSHYMVLLATDGKDMVYISNPNGLSNSNNSSGWYKFDYIIPYIAKVLFIESY